MQHSTQHIKPHIDPTDLQIMKEEFLDFGDMWNITTHLLRSTFKKFLKSILLIKVFLTVLLMLSLFVISLPVLKGSLDSIDFVVGESTYSITDVKAITGAIDKIPEGETPTIKPELTRYKEYQNNHRNQFLLVGFLFLILTISYLIFQLFIRIRTFQMLHDDTDTLLSKPPAGIIKKFIKVIVFSFVIGLISGFIDLFSGVISQFGIDTLKNLAGLVFYGLLGMYFYYISTQNLSLSETFKKSYNSILPYFWSNTFRWLLLNIIRFAFLIIACLVSIIALYILSLVFDLYGNTTTTFIFLVFGILAIFVLYFVEIFVDIFNYVSNLNIDLLRDSNEEI
jgi:hypothetical protein